MTCHDVRRSAAHGGEREEDAHRSRVCCWQLTAETAVAQAGASQTPLRRLFYAQNVSACQHANSFIEASPRHLFTQQRANSPTPVCLCLSSVGDGLCSSEQQQLMLSRYRSAEPQWGDERAERRLRAQEWELPLGAGREPERGRNILLPVLRSGRCTEAGGHSYA